VLIAETTTPENLTGAALEPSTSSPQQPVVRPTIDLLAQEIKASIWHQYFLAAEKGQISRIRAWRIVRGLDQAELARRAGMTQPEISRAERPGRVARMKVETLRRIAKGLHVSVDDLL